MNFQPKSSLECFRIVQTNKIKSFSINSHMLIYNVLSQSNLYKFITLCHERSSEFCRVISNKYPVKNVDYNHIYKVFNLSELSHEISNSPFVWNFYRNVHICKISRLCVCVLPCIYNFCAKQFKQFKFRNLNGFSLMCKCMWLFKSNKIQKHWPQLPHL